MWTAHTSLRLSRSRVHNTRNTIECFSTSLCRSLRNLRTLLEHQAMAVVDLVDACRPFVEMGIFEFFPITIPSSNLTVESVFGS